MDTSGDKRLFSKSLSVIPAPSISESEEHSRLPTLDEDEDILTLDQSFAARQYSGSFRLKFSTRESIVGKEGLAATVGEPEPIRTDSSQELNLEDGPELNCSSEEELQEVSLKFTTEDGVFGGEECNLHKESHLVGQSTPLQHFNEEQKLSTVYEKGQEFELKHHTASLLDKPWSSMTSSHHCCQITGEASEDILTLMQGHTLYDEMEASTAMKNSGVGEDSSNGEFKFFSPEVEPVLHPNYEKRAQRAVKFAVRENNSIIDRDKCCTGCEGCFTGCCYYEVGVSKKAYIPNLTPEMKFASNQGLSMIQKVLFPAIPKFLTDILVLAELGITVTQFVLSLISISIENNRAYNVAYIIIASIALILALLDAFIYFIQLGSCAAIFRHCYSMYNKSRGKVIESLEQKKHEKSCCQCLNPKVKRWLAQSFELLRTIVSEFFIYPLVILDLFDLIVGGTYLRQTMADRINFSLFVIGSAFLVLSVYFTRIFMVISAAVNIRRTPLDPSKSKSSMIDLVTQFCVHVILQVVAHIAIIVIIGAKIHQENPDPCADLQSSCKSVSPFLVYTIIIGGILPVYGIGVFFIINYYNLRVLSIGFWVNMLALLQSESFAVAVFSYKAIEESKVRAQHIIEKIKYEEVKNKLMSFESPPTWIRFLYPLRFPIFVAIAALYEFLLISFIGCLAFDINQNGQVQFVLFEKGLSSVFFVVGVLLIVANQHVLALVSMWILIVLAFIILLLLQPVIWIATALFYPTVATVIFFIHCLTERRRGSLDSRC